MKMRDAAFRRNQSPRCLQLLAHGFCMSGFAVHSIVCATVISDVRADVDLILKYEGTENKFKIKSLDFLY